MLKAAIFLIIAISALGAIGVTTSIMNSAIPANAQTEGGCPSGSNPQNHFCGNPHSPEFSSSVPRPPPLPSCTSPNSVAISPNPISGACRIVP